MISTTSCFLKCRNKREVKPAGKSIDAVKVELDKVKKCATDAMSQIEEIAQFVRRDCLEISGIKPSAESTCEILSPQW